MSFVDAHVEYGCWISPDNNVEHRMPRIQKAPGRSISSAEGNVTSLSERGSVRDEAVYGDLYRSGYVEVRYRGGATMEVWGATEAISRSRHLWGSMTPSIKNITLYTIDMSECANGLLENEIAFAFPAQIGELNNFLGLD
ncbi:MAG: hypothetical protein R3261_07705 [Alphaproteobacteria bacterium]|nr:hypothetical protein [Alphaproteobacteria bacterium]